MTAPLQTIRAVFHSPTRRVASSDGAMQKNQVEQEETEVTEKEETGVTRLQSLRLLC